MILQEPLNIAESIREKNLCCLGAFGFFPTPRSLDIQKKNRKGNPTKKPLEGLWEWGFQTLRKK